MSTSIRGELLKATTTRTLPAYALTGLALTVANILVVTQFSGDVSNKREALAGTPTLILLLGLVGATAEYRHRTAAPAALADHGDRGRLLLARAAVYGALGLALAALLAVVSVALGLPLLGGQPGPALDIVDVASVVGGTLVAAVLSGPLGVAIGALVRNQLAAVIATLLLAFVVNALIGNLNDGLGEYTPFGAAAVLAANSPGQVLGLWSAAMVLIGWTVPLLAVAVVLERTRDLA